MPDSTAARLWKKYSAWLEANHPAHHANLAPPASPEEIAQLEEYLGVELPSAVKDVWLINNGQRHSMHAVSDVTPEMLEAIPTLTFFSTDLVRQIWDQWAELRAAESPEELAAHSEGFTSTPNGAIRCLYTDPKWIPIWGDPGRSDYIGIDLNPDREGHVGQFINFGRNEDRKFVAADSFEQLLEILLWEVEVGCWLPHQKPQRSAAEAEDDDDDDDDDEGTWDGHFFMALHGHHRWRLERVPRSWSYLVVEDEDNGGRYFWREDGLDRRDLNQLLGRAQGSELFVYRSRDRYVRVLGSEEHYDLTAPDGQTIARGASREAALETLLEFATNSDGPECHTRLAAS